MREVCGFRFGGKVPWRACTDDRAHVEHLYAYDGHGYVCPGVKEIA